MPRTATKSSDELNHSPWGEFWMCPAYGWGVPGYFAQTKPERCMLESRTDHGDDCGWVVISKTLWTTDSTHA